MVGDECWAGVKGAASCYGVEVGEAGLRPDTGHVKHLPVHMTYLAVVWHPLAYLAPSQLQADSRERSLARTGLGCLCSSHSAEGQGPGRLGECPGERHPAREGRGRTVPSRGATALHRLLLWPHPQSYEAQMLLRTPILETRKS